MPRRALAVLLLVGLASAQGAPPDLVLQFGHGDEPDDAAFAPGGQSFATADLYQNAARAFVWDVASGRQVATLRSRRRGGEVSVAYHPDGRYLLLGPELFDTRNGTPVRSYALPDRYTWVYGAGFDSSGKTLLLAALHSSHSSAPDKRFAVVRVFETASGRLRHDLKLPEATLLRTAALAPDGRHAAALLATTPKPSLAIWNLVGKTSRVVLLDVHEPYEERRAWQNRRHGDVTFHPKEPRVYVAMGKSVVAVDFETRETREILRAPERVTGVAVHPDGAQLLVSHAKALLACDAKTGAVRATVPARSARVVGFDADGERHLVLHQPSWGRTTGDVRLTKSRMRLGFVPVRPFPVTPGIVSLKYTGDGKRIRLGLRSIGADYQCDVTVQTFDLERARMEPMLPLYRVRYSSPWAGRVGMLWAWTKDGSRLLSLSPGSGEHATLWDVDARRPVRRFAGDGGYVGAVGLSDDGTLAIIANSPGRNRRRERIGPDIVTVWDTASGTRLHRLELTLADQSVAAAAFTPDKRRFLLGLRAGRVAVHDTKTGKRLATMGKGDRIGGFAIRPDGRQVACFNAQGAFCLYLGNLDDYSDIIALPQKDYVSHLAYSPDGKTLVSAPRRLRLMDTSSFAIRRIAVETTPGRVAWRPDGAQLAWTPPPLYGGFVDFLDPAAGQFAGRLYLTDYGREWFAVTGTGHFTGSPDLVRRVGWRIGGSVFPIDLYGWAFHRADVVAHFLRGEDAKAAPRLSVVSTPPKVRIVPDGVNHAEIRCRIEAAPAAGRALRQMRVFVDGRDVALRGGSPVAIERRPEGWRGRCRIPFPPGKTKAVVAAIATDDKGTQSLPAAVTLVRPGKPESVKRTLYVLAVGVSKYRVPRMNLRYCDADATGLTKAWQEQKGLAFDDVRTRVLVNAGATRKAVRDALRWLQESATPRDVAIVQFSGHGAHVPGAGLYYVTHEAATDDVAGTCLPWADVARALGAVRASQILFLADCCHSGAFVERRASQDQLAALLLRDARVMVFTASRGLELSLEMDRLRHGAFTYALLNGLRGAADLIPDRRITIAELQTYVTHRVKQLTSDLQHPHIPLMQDFDPDLVVAHVR